MGLAGLDQALSGIRVAQQQLDVLSNNISNAQVEGFTRKILPQSTLVLSGRGAGVLAETIIRKVDTNLQLDLLRQTSIEAFLTTKADSLDRIQQFHGAPDSNANFAALLAQLRDSFAGLDNDPGDPLLINDTLKSAETFAKRIRDFADLLQEIRNDAEDDIASSVTRINQILVQIADLNGQISFNTAAGRTTAQLEDQRDQALTELSQYIEVSSYKRGDGVLVVQTNTGQQLADERVREMYFQPTNIGPDSFYPSSINGLYVGGNPLSNSGSFDITDTKPGGSIGALIELRDDVIPRFQAQLDELAANVADRFDRQGLRLFTNQSGGLPDFTLDPDSTPDIEYISPAAIPADIFAGLSPLTAPPAASQPLNFILNVPGVGAQTLSVELSALDGTGPLTPDANGIAYLINQEIQNNPNIDARDFLIDISSSGELTVRSEYAFTIDGTALAVGSLQFIGLESDADNTESFALPFFGSSTQVDYVGFSQEFQVNPAVINTPSLLQSGTLLREDGPVQPGSNEVIRRILEFTFGDAEFQQATTVDIGLDPVSGVPVRLQDSLGLFASNRIEGTIDLETVGNLFAAPGSPLTDPALAAGAQEFNINLVDPTTNAVFNITIDLNDLDGVTFSQDIDGLINLINTRIDTATAIPPLPPPPAVSLPTPEGRDIYATKSGGKLVFHANFDVEFSTTGGSFPGTPDPANPAPATTLQFLGLETDGNNYETYTATQPYIDIAVGDNEFTRISIDTDDTLADFQSKLNLETGVDADGGVPDLIAEIVTNQGDMLNPLDDVSRLRIRPGQLTDGADQDGDGLYDAPGFGGELRLIGGPFETAAGQSILESLFGTLNPVQNVQHRPFRFQDLGPQAGLNTGIDGVETLVSYAQNAINNQTSETIVTEAALEDESAFRETLLRQFQNQSGVNIDEELSNLILVQTAFSAAARAVSAIDELFKELLNAIA